MDDSRIESPLNSMRLPLALAAALLLARLAGLLTLPFAGLRGYGDFISYFQTASLPGWPFLNYWVEYPPVFPFLNEWIFRLAGGQEHIHQYLLVLALMLFDSGSIYLFARLALRLYPLEQGLMRAGIYLLVLAGFAYTWWYFDPIVVFWMLLGLTLLLERRLITAGLALGLGVAAKFFPFLALLVMWRRCTWRQMVLLVLLSLAPLVLMVAALWQSSPDFTAASFRSQWGKGSWETVWALLDNNIRTGSFGPVAERLDPAKTISSGGANAAIPPLFSLPVFAGLGLLVMFLVRPADERQSLALVAFAWILFILWSPGWSPQWVLYSLPLVLLVLPLRHAVLFSALLVLVNVMEWPVLLSRGYFHLLWAPILLRLVLHLALAAVLAEMLLRNRPSHRPLAKPGKSGGMV